jgi:hypothetical protein
MNKFKSWIKRKIMKFLDIDANKILFDYYVVSNNKALGELNKKLDGVSASNDLDHKYFYKQLQHERDSIDILHNTIENVVHIGTDVRESRYNDGHSWAVVCIEGKINLVKFVDLGRNDAL